METHRLLASLRKKQRKSLADLAGPAGLSRTTILRAEREDAPVEEKIAALPPAKRKKAQKALDDLLKGL